MYVFSSSVVAVSAAALLAPLTPLAAPPASAGALPRAAEAERAAGRTQSLPLAPLGSSSRGPGAGTMGLSKPDAGPFTMVGVVWKDPEAELDGRARVRARSAETGRWSGWQDLDPHAADAPDPGSGAEPGGEAGAGAGGGAAARRGGTAPLWVGESTGVEVRVVPARSRSADAAGAAGAAEAVGAAGLPRGLTAELIDPGGAGAGTGKARAAGTAAAGELAAQTKAASEADAVRLNPALPAAVGPFVGPRPEIVTRKGWGADESRRAKGYRYTKTVNIAFVHHSATGNDYRCTEAPGLVRGIYRYHTQSLNWADVGYNFLVDKCGRVYEGRAGGVTRAVMGAHTYGFNHNSMGIAVLGSYDSAVPSQAAVNAVSRLTAWKLGLFGKDPEGKQTKVSGGGKYARGTRVRMNVISGHRDGFATACPGVRLYDRLGATRASSASYQGRR
ncbi:N-acetylmuramoyl-L-alanine amidase family protein [Streptomyces sp. CNQ-509]|uniref:peptidoglycan recognition protein family protein n=1 Tax=Streptomyces sp. CNQ-509 TaxID=444103 RepID=UPI00062DE428|nr:peptidoglycan recognition protein [Streptomyces sp. CNQ-509]AKH82745.1 N-acetylmuramoyl-L-alanine amidase family protein [Streptomyces sp. CNQ-509]